MKNALINTIAWLTGASRAVIKFILPVLRDSATSLLAEIAPIAIEVVKSLMDSPAAGNEKQRVAMERIKQLAISEGINASTRAINLSIELALAQIKGISAE
jgi:hypothetical protein